MSMDFTQRDINAWRSYERVRQKGAYNMFDPKARAASRLSREEYAFCMRHYIALKEAAEATTRPPAAPDKDHTP